MDRLTVDTNLTFCDIAQCSNTPGGSFCEDGYCDQRRCYERLREYERIGTIEEFCATLRRTAEHDKAMEEGLPCKVGDTLYEIDLPEYGVITCKVLWIGHYNGPAFHAPGGNIVSIWSAHVEVIDGHGKGSTYDFEQSDFGKTVFLTRAEAEAALDGGGEGG